MSANELINRLIKILRRVERMKWENDSKAAMLRRAMHNGTPSIT